MTYRQLRLLALIKRLHGDQQRKYNEGPYWCHPLRVGQMANEYVPFGLEIGFLHDVFEDVEGISILGVAERMRGYEKLERGFILSRAWELKNVYTHKAFPEYGRAQRKYMEHDRLRTIHPTAQTVKYCDIMDNVPSIAKNEPEFAKTYVIEKMDCIRMMNKGHRQALVLCEEMLKFYQDKLKNPNYYEI